MRRLVVQDRPNAWPLTTMLMVGYMAMQRWMWLSRRCVARWRSWFLDRANLSSSDTQPRSLHRHIPSSSDSNMPMHAVQMFEWRSFKAPFQISFIFFYLRLLPLGLNLWLCCCDQKWFARKNSVVLFAVDIANLSKQHHWHSRLSDNVDGQIVAACSACGF